MADDKQLLVGKWAVWVKDWSWEYEFLPNGTVTWRDTRSPEKGTGKWSTSNTLVNISWNDSSTKESWRRPLNSGRNKNTYYSAPYFSGAYSIEKVGQAGPLPTPPRVGPYFWKDPETGSAGSKFTADGKLWRQEIALGSSATVALKHYTGLVVGLNNQAIAKLVQWKYDSDDLYVDIVPTMVGNAYLEARSDSGVADYIQIGVSLDTKGAIDVDDFQTAYYSVDYRHSGGNLSKWIVLEYRDSVVIDINIDEISDTPAPSAEKGWIGRGGRRFPARLNPATTPRLHTAKKRALSVMAEHYADFLQTASSAIFFILTINPIVMPIEAPTSVRPIPRRNLPRSVASHVDTPPAAVGRTTIQGKDVNEAVIRSAMENAPLKSQQKGGISLPKVQEFVDKLNAGEVPPPIRVDDGIIVEGNHRYVAGRVVGKDPPIQEYVGGRPERVVQWKDMPISRNKW